MRPSMAALFKNSTLSMKPINNPADGMEARQRAAKRTALIVGLIAVFLFVLSIVEVALKK